MPHSLFQNWASRLSTAGISGNDPTQTGLAEEPAESDKKCKAEMEPAGLAPFRLLTAADKDSD